MGSFFAPEIDMSFGDGVGASLVCLEVFFTSEISRLFEDTVGASLVRGRGCQFVVAMMCDADVCGLIPTTRLKRAFEWRRKQASRRHQIQNAEGPVLDLAQSKYILEETQKWTLLGSKVVPPGGPVFGPFILLDVLCAKCQA